MTHVFNTDGPTTVIFFEVVKASDKLLMKFINSRYADLLEIKRCPRRDLLKPGSFYAVEVRNLPLKDGRWSWIWPADEYYYVEMSQAECINLSHEFFREPEEVSVKVTANPRVPKLLEF